ncbi:MAG: hypothetical protein F7B20_00995 [Aeropyrum sp.]|nr:hypothetical protein [Aeropyrum sp.]MCE4616538.1 hypothetical protein [Aeropyrum sp.]
MARLVRGSEAATVALAVLFALLSIYFFANAMSLITLEEPRVAASILASLIGLALLSASVSLVRILLLSRIGSSEEKRGLEEKR